MEELLLKSIGILKCEKLKVFVNIFRSRLARKHGSHHNAEESDSTRALGPANSQISSRHQMEMDPFAMELRETRRELWDCGTSLARWFDSWIVQVN